LSECSAPWKTIEALDQRTARSRPNDIDSTSSSSSRTRPVTAAVLGVSRSTVAASVDLPDPDSPATPRLVPASTSSDTPRTAGTSPSAVR
jgi:hypothetical protein